MANPYEDLTYGQGSLPYASGHLAGPIAGEMRSPSTSTESFRWAEIATPHMFGQNLSAFGEREVLETISAAYEAGRTHPHNTIVLEEYVPSIEQNLPADQADAPDAEASCLHATCRWVETPGAKPCGLPLTCEEVSHHFRMLHGIKNIAETDKLICQWEGCWERRGRKNYIRHVQERHLGHSRDRRHSPF